MIDAEGLYWDAWNVDHIARHGVTQEQVEEVCRGTVHTSETYGGRLRVIGRTATGNLLTVILAPQAEESYYVVTARPASRKERYLYRSEIGVDES